MACEASGDPSKCWVSASDCTTSSLVDFCSCARKATSILFMPPDNVPILSSSVFRLVGARGWKMASNDAVLDMDGKAVVIDMGRCNEKKDDIFTSAVRVSTRNDE
jgi:hypothetical protein